MRFVFTPKVGSHACFVLNRLSKVTRQCEVHATIVIHPVALSTRKMLRRHSCWGTWCSCIVKVTAVSLSLTRTLRTWTQRQTYTVPTDACLKCGSSPDRLYHCVSVWCLLKWFCHVCRERGHTVYSTHQQCLMLTTLVSKIKHYITCRQRPKHFS